MGKDYPSYDPDQVFAPNCNEGIMKTHEVVDRVAAIETHAIRLWACMVDLDSNGLLDRDADGVLRTMLPHMRETVLRIAPLVAAWLDTLSDGSGK